MEKTKFRLIIIVLLLGIIAPAVMQAQERMVRLVPYPARVEVGKGEPFVFTSHTVISVDLPEGEFIAKRLAEVVSEKLGAKPQAKAGHKKGEVTFVIDKNMKPESYRLDITAKHITVRACNIKGYFYAVESLRQLIADANTGSEQACKLPPLMVFDEPRFSYRGAMIDVARHFTSKDNMLKIIDCMSMLKLNKLHLHLSDDTGWRMEIKKYPLLTQVGSRRVERNEFFPERANPRQGEPTVEKGFYTQEDLKAIVAYAAQRQIEVIPEIDMPAHTNALLAAYPLLACPVVDKYIGVLPGLGGDHADIILCAGNEQVYTFIQDVIDEVMEVFPSEHIHLGGDEAFKTYWHKCPLCQQKIKDEHLHDAEALQGYFMSRVGKYVESKGRKVMGWDEIVNAEMPKSAIVFGWQGDGKAALKASAQGHKFVMTPAKKLYFIRYQGPQWYEPMTYFGNNTLKDVYEYEPIERYWADSDRNNLLGIQGSLWTEFCETQADVEYLLFPRLVALAEGAWSSTDVRNWHRFMPSLDQMLALLQQQQVIVAQSMYNIQHTVTPLDDKLQVSLTCERPDVQIFYTTDGSNPTDESTEYKWSFTLTEASVIKAATFKNGKQMGKTLVLPIEWNLATAKRMMHANNVEKLVVNGVKGSLKSTDGEWANWTQNDSIAMTFDLRKREELHQISMQFINNHGMGIYKPRSIRVQVSNNNIEYWTIATKQYEANQLFMPGIFIEKAVLDLDDTARYVRVIIRGAGTIPPLTPRPGQQAKVYIDEVSIE